MGGSHGGSGGVPAGGSTNPTYGHFAQPTTLGASGSSGNDTNTVPGGGALRLTVSGTLTVDGTISSSATGAPYGGAAGGSVWITTDTLTGTGSIAADGSDGAANASYAGGGGGRVAVYYTTLAGGFAYSGIYNAVHAYGGRATGTHHGAAGTVYLKSGSQTWGDLIINNRGYDTASAAIATTIPYPSGTTSTALAATTLTTSADGFANAYGATNYYNGLYLAPNINQNATQTLMDDTCLYPILSNTTDTFTVSNASAPCTNITDAASVGNTFKLLLYLDNLEVRQKGKVSFTGQRIVAREGDVSSGNTSAFIQDGMITAGVVDINAATWSTTANASGTVTTKCASNFACP